LIQVAVGLQERVLNDIFSVFPVLRNVLRDTKNVAIVSSNQVFECRDVALLGRLYQCQFVANGLTYLGLDGAHSRSDAVFCRAFTKD